jgi:hypothetical protein
MFQIQNSHTTPQNTLLRETHNQFIHCTVYKTQPSKLTLSVHTAFPNDCGKSEQFEVILQHTETDNSNNSVYLFKQK